MPKSSCCAKTARRAHPKNRASSCIGARSSRWGTGATRKRRPSVSGRCRGASRLVLPDRGMLREYRAHGCRSSLFQNRPARRDDQDVGLRVIRRLEEVLCDDSSARPPRSGASPTLDSHRRRRHAMPRNHARCRHAHEGVPATPAAYMVPPPRNPAGRWPRNPHGKSIEGFERAPGAATLISRGTARDPAVRRRDVLSSEGPAHGLADAGQNAFYAYERRLSSPASERSARHLPPAVTHSAMKPSSAFARLLHGSLVDGSTSHRGELAFRSLPA